MEPEVDAGRLTSEFSPRLVGETSSRSDPETSAAGRAAAIARPNIVGGFAAARSGIVRTSARRRLAETLDRGTLRTPQG